MREIAESPAAACRMFVSRDCREKGGRRSRQRPGHERVMCLPQQIGPCTVQAMSSLGTITNPRRHVVVGRLGALWEQVN